MSWTLMADRSSWQFNIQHSTANFEFWSGIPDLIRYTGSEYQIQHLTFRIQIFYFFQNFYLMHARSPAELIMSYFIISYVFFTFFDPLKPQRRMLNFESALADQIRYSGSEYQIQHSTFKIRIFNFFQKFYLMRDPPRSWLCHILL